MGSFVVVMRKLWSVRVVVGEEGVGAGRGICGFGSGLVVREMVVKEEVVGRGGPLGGGGGLDIESPPGVWGPVLMKVRYQGV